MTHRAFAALPSRLRVPLFPLVALPCGVVLLQWHGGQFWADKTGSQVWGWGASALLEWLALWAWHAEARAEAEGENGLFVFGRMVAAGLVTALLIAGPLYQVGAPLLREAQETAALADRVDRTDASLARLYRASDQGRKVGREIVEMTMEANAAQADAFGPDARGSRKALPGTERILIGAQLVALVFFSVGCVAAIRTLGGWNYGLSFKGAMDSPAVDLGIAQDSGNGIDHGPLADVFPKPLQRDEPSLGSLGLTKESGAGEHPGAGSGVRANPARSISDPAIVRAAPAVEIRETSGRRETGALAATEGVHRNSVSVTGIERLADRRADVARVTQALTAAFPRWREESIAGLTDPSLKVELSRLKNFDRDLARQQAGDKTVKLIGPAELARLEALAARVIAAVEPTKAVETGAVGTGQAARVV